MHLSNETNFFIFSSLKSTIKHNKCFKGKLKFPFNLLRDCGLEAEISTQYLLFIPLPYQPIRKNYSDISL